MTGLLETLAPYRRAIAAALVAALTTPATLVDGRLTVADVLTIAAAAVAAGVGVYAVPNRPPVRHPQPPTAERTD
ncbi:hypothetical protein K8Z61_09330 [Nocardioides sp. TRM66260-LWL]|uniref:hypothetical protein n=1 Tax=Nocardioides sp. TRM66260-LWL TaxID=2874478 RepID=UPI001CC58DF3|nr:hypothetical protein [Nocardioides sp. TRM66260-LWL]MBZ5734696.1 hypothetical protein [Nocardioides sp. TRM66260-LWL]